MNKLVIKSFLFTLFFLFMISGQGNAQIFHKDPERKLFGKTHIKTKEPKVKQPRSVLRAKRKQEANDAKLKKENAKSVKQSQKRTVDIQTPEVQDRMKQNKKDYTARDRSKQKKLKSERKKARKKYD
jgi:hypothetical protein